MLLRLDTVFIADFDAISFERLIDVAFTLALRHEFFGGRPLMALRRPDARLVTRRRDFRRRIVALSRPRGRACSASLRMRHRRGRVAAAGAAADASDFARASAHP